MSCPSFQKWQVQPLLVLVDTTRATPLFVERQAVNDSPAQWSTLVVERAALSPIDYDLPHTQDLQS
jgi:hypothetical protein